MTRNDLQCIHSFVIVSVINPVVNESIKTIKLVHGNPRTHTQTLDDQISTFIFWNSRLSILAVAVTVPSDSFPLMCPQNSALRAGWGVSLSI